MGGLVARFNNIRVGPDTGVQPPPLGEAGVQRTEPSGAGGFFIFFDVYLYRSLFKRL